MKYIIYYLKYIIYYCNIQFYSTYLIYCRYVYGKYYRTIIFCGSMCRHNWKRFWNYHIKHTKHDLSPQNCIANSTDGAANMQGEYNFSMKMQIHNSNHVHI